MWIPLLFRNNSAEQHNKKCVILRSIQPITIRSGSQHCQAVLSLVEIFAENVRHVPEGLYFEPICSNSPKNDYVMYGWFQFGKSWLKRPFG